jgi:hypothetical protein
MPQEWKEFIIVPIHKKGDKTKCSNYWGMSFLSTAYEILSNILCGFRRNRSTTDQIFYIR